MALVDGRPVLDQYHHNEDMLYGGEIELESKCLHSSTSIGVILSTDGRSHPAMLEVRKLKALMEKARQRKEQMAALEAKLAHMQAQLRAQL